ncbi:ATP-binding cassette domain-containing protein [Azospirillum sp.]|uniref:ATP-binding cassette domain-containing protein n=1 Tax=Azospirillum sp. TaxID=34012 RepID=UPI002D422BCA|nr:ATP-binding cassette domain-containing protein [Azospirillum sp.]HYD64548.1 ATP-binding cassette domain-containing protein [Azospirillum sp.]
MYVFRVSGSSDGPVIGLERRVARPEWLPSTANGGGLLAVHASAARARVLVVATRADTIDEFTLDGDFVDSRHVLSVCPALFGGVTPTGAGARGLTFLNGLAEDARGRLFAVLGEIRGTGRGAVMSWDTGEVLLSDLPMPYGARIHENSFYVSLAEDGVIREYELADGALESVAGATPRLLRAGISDPDRPDSPRFLRQPVIVGDKIWCPDAHGSRSAEVHCLPHLVQFGRTSGAFERAIFVPTKAPLSPPMLLGLQPVPAAWRDWLPPAVAPRTEIGPKSLAKALGLSRPAARKRGREPVPTVPGEAAVPPSELSSPAKGSDRPVVIDFDQVGISYQRLERSGLGRLLRGRQPFWALRDVSFAIRERETVAVIGRNGSGKSTIAKVIAGVFQADRGAVRVDGRACILTLGTGFKSNLSGYDNIFISGALMGASRREISRKLDEIVSFAELADFIDAPVREYSSGMRSRLAFAIATAMTPDILVLDEALAAGDHAYRERARTRLSRLIEAARCMILISHQMSFVRETCQRVIWLDKGRLIMDGPTEPVIDAYMRFSRDASR